jgi:hypothetical protein
VYLLEVLYLLALLDLLKDPYLQEMNPLLQEMNQLVHFLDL